MVAESTASRDGKFVESIGFYNPRTDPETVRIQEERALHWLSVGAQPTESVARIFRTHGTMDRFERLRGGESLSTLIAEVEKPVAEPAPVAVEVVEVLEAETVPVAAEVAEVLEAEPAPESVEVVESEPADAVSELEIAAEPASDDVVASEAAEQE